jgi:hypothetical protein
VIQFTAATKDSFFDRPAVMKLIDETESKAFNKIGGRIRTTAMRSMRQQKRPKKKAYVQTASTPGQPPRRRVPLGSGLTKIYYAYSAANHQVQIGPVKFNWSAFPEMTVPQVHEFGGRVKIVEVDYSVTREGWQTRSEPLWIQVGPRGQRSRGRRPIRTRTANYPKRPFMFPALEKNMQFIRDTWSKASVSVG